MDQWFADWLDTHRDGDDDPSFYDQFAEYWGLGDSFDCAIDDECNVPQCTQIKRPTQVDEYEQANMYLASMANFNKVHYQAHSVNIILYNQSTNIFIFFM